MEMLPALLFLLGMFVIETTSLPRHQDETVDDNSSFLRSVNPDVQKTDFLELILDAGNVKKSRTKSSFSIRDFLLKKTTSRKPEIQEIEENARARAYIKDLVTAGNAVDENIKQMNESKKQPNEHDCVASHNLEYIGGRLTRVVKCEDYVTTSCSDTAKKYGTGLCKERRASYKGYWYTYGCECQT